MQLVLHKVRAGHKRKSAEAGIPEVRMGLREEQAEQRLGERKCSHHPRVQAST